MKKSIQKQNQNFLQQSLQLPRKINKISLNIGHVFTFGSGVGGELGLSAHINERRKPGNVKLLNDKQIIAIECGGQHTLALDTNGHVYSWGINDQGALGRKTNDEVMDDADSDEENDLRGDESWAPFKVQILDDSGKDAFIVQLVCADSFCAVLSSDGDVYAWGSFRDPSGILGFNKNMEKKVQHLPTKIRAFGKEKVVLLGSGENFIFAVTADDTLWAFGANDEHQLGRRVSSRFKNNLEPYEIRGIGKRQSILHEIVKITGGAYHTLYINCKGELYSFGCNNCGQLGLGDIDPHLNGPERVEFAIAADGKSRIPLPPIIDIAAGESHSLAVSVDGRLFTWGANLEGQLGYITERPVYGDERDFMIVKQRSPPKGEQQSQNNSLQPSDNASYKLMFQPYPREIPQFMEDDQHGLPPLSQDKIIQVDAQSRFSIAVSNNGNLYTFGSGHSYQLGNEEMEDENIPFQVELKGRKVISARCGGQFTMFLLEPKDKSDGVPVANPRQANSQDADQNGDRMQEDQADESQIRYIGNNNHINNNNIAAQGNFGNYRLSVGVPQTSAPNSPQKRLPAAPTSDVMKDVDTRGRTLQSNSSPNDITKGLSKTFETVCVSPERKRQRNENSSLFGSPSYTKDEKMAPWSPKRGESPQIFNASTQPPSFMSPGKKTLSDRLNKLKKGNTNESIQSKIRRSARNN